MSEAKTTEISSNNDAQKKLETRTIGTLKICPIVNGLWQISGYKWNNKDILNKSVKSMFEYSKNNLNTWDGADIYRGSELIMGIHKKNKGNGIYFTKYVESELKSKSYIIDIIKNQCKTMNTTSLDLLQFHWWDYNDKDYITVLKHLKDIRDNKKLIKNLGLTNFNTDSLKLMYKHIKDINIVSNQIPYSIIDTRFENNMLPFCQKNDIKILTYGTLLGGFLSNKWLGKSEPSYNELSNISLRKYIKWIKSWSNNNWKLFQELLNTLNNIGKQYNVSISQVGIKYILDKPSVGGVIIGCHLGKTQYINETIGVFNIKLTKQDKIKIENVIKKGRALRGDPADEYRGTKL